MVSSRARALASQPASLVELHFRAAQDPWHPENNPEGYINLGTAENHLLWDLVGPLLEAAPALGEQDVHYDLLHGRESTRVAVAGILARIHDIQADPDELVLTSGASSALDMLATSLLEPGEGALVTSPFYAGFAKVLVMRSGAQLVEAPTTSEDGFAFDMDALEAAYRQASADGVPIGALVVCNPHNPTGRCPTRGELGRLATFAHDHDLDIIADELYAGSTHDRAAFTSLATVADDPARVHTVYGFAKDLGVSGFKIGVLHSRDQQLLAAARALAYLSPVSTSTQHLLEHLLTDQSFVDEWLAENPRRLKAAYDHTSALLVGAGIGHLDAQAGFFAWLDLRSELDETTFEAEAALHKRLFEQAKVNLAPGASFHSPEPGWFRLCYAEPAETLEAGIERLGEALG